MGDDPRTPGDRASLALLLAVSLYVATLGWLVVLSKHPASFPTRVVGGILIVWPSLTAAYALVHARTTRMIRRFVGSFVLLLVSSLLVMLGIVALGYGLE